LAEFLRRLESAPSARTFEEAYSQISNILNEVEDELTAIPNHPENWQTDGRLYPPKLDNVRTVPDKAAIKRFRSVGHNTFIEETAALKSRLSNQRK